VRLVLRDLRDIVAFKGHKVTWVHRATAELPVRVACKEQLVQQVLPASRVLRVLRVTRVLRVQRVLMD